MAFRANPGRLPADAIGKRVRVRLVGDQASQQPRNWPADGKGGCSWARRGSPFDIAEYEVIA